MILSNALEKAEDVAPVLIDGGGEQTGLGCGGSHGPWPNLGLIRTLESPVLSIYLCGALPATLGAWDCHPVRGQVPTLSVSYVELPVLASAVWTHPPRCRGVSG